MIKHDYSSGVDNVSTTVGNPDNNILIRTEPSLSNKCLSEVYITTKSELTTRLDPFNPMIGQLTMGVGWYRVPNIKGTLEVYMGHCRLSASIHLIIPPSFSRIYHYANFTDNGDRIMCSVSSIKWE